MLNSASSFGSISFVLEARGQAIDQLLIFIQPIMMRNTRKKMCRVKLPNKLKVGVPGPVIDSKV